MSTAEYQFRVPAVPVAQPRQRLAVRGCHAVNYTPSKHPVQDFKASVRMAAEGARVAPLDGPVLLTMEFVMPRPKSMVWKKRPMPRERHDKKPDWDNLAKSVCDALKGLAWRDDSQVSDAVVRKRIAAGDEAPHVVIAVGPADTL
jgi:Holliday junction resolvase RusA-like endonuclease